MLKEEYSSDRFEGNELEATVENSAKFGLWDQKDLREIETWRILTEKKLH